MSPTRLTSLRDGLAPLLLYPVLALLSFPTLGQALAGQDGLAYAHDVFDLPRSGVLGDWLAHGPTLWNTHVTAGNALLAQQAISPYAIDVWLAFLVGPFAAYAILAWLQAAVAGLSMHLFLRDSMRLPVVAVLLGATMYLFGFWHVTYGFVVPALPLLLWLTDRAVAAGPARYRFVLAASLAGGLLLYHGQSQLVLLAAALQLAWLVATAVRQDRDLRRRLGTWLLTWAAAFGLFAPVLLTQLVMLPISQRAIWDLDVLYDHRPLEATRDTLETYSAAVLGAPVGGSWGSSPDAYGTFFLGAVGLALIAVAIVADKGGRRTWFFLGLLVVIPLVDLVAVLLTPVQEQLGLVKSFQFVRVRHLYPFALVVVASLGLGVLIDGIGARTGHRIVPVRRRLAIAGAVTAAVALPLVVTTVVAAGQVLTRRRDLRALDPAALGWAFVLLALVGGMVLVAIVLVAILRGRWSVLGTGSAALLLFAALIGERAVYAHGERFIAERDLGTWRTSVGVTSPQAFLLGQPGSATDRVLTFGEHANRMGAVGLLQADGYQAIYPLTYNVYFSGMIRPASMKDPAIATYVGSWGNRAYAFLPDVDPELVALAGVRWLYVVGDADPTVPAMVERFHEDDVRVFEVSDVLPRAFIAGAVATATTTAGVVEALADASLDELRAVAWLVEGPDAAAAAAVLPGGADGSAGPAGSATIISYGPDRVEIAVDADRPGMLVLTDVMAPGWMAERDGTPVPLLTVDGTFRGVPVEPGTRRVTFDYRPVFTYVGFGIAIAVLVVAIVWAVWERRRDDLGTRSRRGATP